MSEQRPLEYCFNCGGATGQAGRGDGSLYCECDAGPFCSDCWEIHHRGNTLLTDTDALVRVLHYLNKPIAYCAYPGYEKDDAYFRVLAMRKEVEVLSQELRDAISGGGDGNCIWKQQDDEWTYWETECGKAFVLNDEGAPIEHDMRYCCYCGRKLLDDAVAALKNLTTSPR